MRVGRRALGVALTLFATAMRPSVARADDTSDIQALSNETVITTASKSAERGSMAPATSTLLTAEDMRRYGIHSIAEAIDFLSLGMVTSSSLRTADVGARGVLIPRDQGDHFLMLVDGHAVNEALYGAARFDRGAGIPMELVDHIEVTLGPGSVLYGSNAMLGDEGARRSPSGDVSPISSMHSESYELPEVTNCSPDRAAFPTTCAAPVAS